MSEETSGAPPPAPSPVLAPATTMMTDESTPSSTTNPIPPSTGDTVMDTSGPSSSSSSSTLPLPTNSPLPATSSPLPPHDSSSSSDPPSLSLPAPSFSSTAPPSSITAVAATMEDVAPSSPSPTPSAQPPSSPAPPVFSPLPSSPSPKPLSSTPASPPPRLQNSPPLNPLSSPAKPRPTPPPVSPSLPLKQSPSLPSSSSSSPSSLTKSPSIKPTPPRVKIAVPSPTPSPPSSHPPTPLPSSSPSHPPYPLPSNVQLALLAKAQGQNDGYGNTTRCICHENDNSDGFMLSCDTCVAVGQAVSVGVGRGRPIELVVRRGEQVLGVGDEGVVRTRVERGAVGRNVKGDRRVSRMWLANGQHLDLTDDHRVFIRSSSTLPISRPARDLRSSFHHALNGGTDEVDHVMMGMDSAVDDCRLDTEDDAQWTFDLPTSTLPPLSFSSSSPHHCRHSPRDRALAFARVLGYVVGKGRVRRRDGEQEVSVRMSHSISVDEWQSDVELVLDGTDKPLLPHWQSRRSGSGYWKLVLPSALSSALCRLSSCADDNVHVASSSFCPPDFLSSSAPLPPSPFVREYLAALYGARAQAVKIRTKSNAVSLHRVVRLPCSPPPTHLCPHHSSKSFLLHAQRLFSHSVPHLTTSDRLSPTSSLDLDLFDLLSFSHTLSYRYDVFKQLRLSVACAYIRYTDNIARQRLLSSSSSPFTDPSTMPILHPSSSPNSPFHLCSFPDFLSIIGLPSLFTSPTLPSLTSSPVYYLPLLALTPLPTPLPLYDHTKHPPHPPSVLVSGMLVHNCEVWQHGDCLSVNERSVPEQYFCELCMPDHPIHMLNDSVKKSAMMRRMKGKGKKGGGVLGSPGMEGKKLDKKKVVEVKVKEAEKKAPEVKPKEPVKVTPVDPTKKKKVKREDDLAFPMKLEQPTKRARVEPPVVQPSVPSQVVTEEEEGDSREQKKLKKLLETIKKIEDQSSKKKKKSDGEEGKEGKDESHVGVGVVEGEEEGMDVSSSPSSPNVSTARSVRAKLRAEREEDTPVEVKVVGNEGSRKKKKGAVGSVSDEDTSDVVDFAYRRRAWQVNKAHHARLGPSYLGRKEFVLAEWKRGKERQETGWDDGVKEEEVGLVKRVIDNWREEKKEKEEMKDDSRWRIRPQTNTDVPTCTQSEVVDQGNSDRKRKREDEEPTASPTKNGAHAPSPPIRPSIPKVQRPINGVGKAAVGGRGLSGGMNNRVMGNATTPH